MVIQNNMQRKDSFKIKLFLLVIFISYIHPWATGLETTVEMVQVIFRHGDRTPDESEIIELPNYEEVNNTWYPFGNGQLTNEGVLHMYQLGEVIREKYSDLILSGIVDETVKTFTSESNRAKTSALAFLAGLLPPTSELQWGTEKTCTKGAEDCRGPDISTLWRPASYTSDPYIDHAINHWLRCPSFQKELRRIQSLPQVEEKMSKYNEIIKILSENSGKKVFDTLDVYSLRNLYNCQAASGVAKPKWLADIWNETNEITNLFFELAFYNDVQKRLGAGEMLKKILDDLQAKVDDAEQLKSPNIIVHSGHDIILIGLYAALGGREGFWNSQGFKVPISIPEFTATLVIELHRSVSTGEYGVKFLYSSGDRNLKSLHRSDCADPCPLEELIRLTKAVTFNSKDIETDCNPSPTEPTTATTTPAPTTFTTLTLTSAQTTPGEPTPGFPSIIRDTLNDEREDVDFQ